MKNKKRKRKKHRILKLNQIEDFCKQHSIQYVVLENNYIWLAAYNFTYNIKERRWTNYLGLKWYYVSDFSTLYFKYCKNNRPYNNKIINNTTDKKNIHYQKTTHLKPSIKGIPPEAKITNISNSLHRLQKLQLVAREIAIAKGYKPVNAISPNCPVILYKPDKPNDDEN